VHDRDISVDVVAKDERRIPLRHGYCGGQCERIIILPFLCDGRIGAFLLVLALERKCRVDIGVEFAGLDVTLILAVRRGFIPGVDEDSREVHSFDGGFAIPFVDLIIAHVDHPLSPCFAEMVRLSSELPMRTHDPHRPDGLYDPNEVFDFRLQWDWLHRFDGELLSLFV
jgi:hypothetical protein